MISNFNSLQITEQEIKNITGFKSLLYIRNKIVRRKKLTIKSFENDKGFYLILVSCLYLAWTCLTLICTVLTSIISSFGILNGYHNSDVMLLMIWMTCYLVVLFYWLTQGPKVIINLINITSPTPLGILLDEVDKFNKAANQMNVVIQLEAVGNDITFKEKEKVMKALISVR